MGKAFPSPLPNLKSFLVADSRSIEKFDRPWLPKVAEVQILEFLEYFAPSPSTVSINTMSLQNTHFEDSEDEDDFNPQQADISDNEDAGGSDHDDDAGAQIRNEVSRRSANVDDGSDDEQPAPSRRRSSADQNDGEEDEDDEDAEGPGEDLNAGADDEDEDENDDDEDELNEIKDNFIADTHPDDLADLPAGGVFDDKRHRELDRRREMEASLDAEKQAEILRQRYANKNRSGRGAGDSAVVPRRLLLPSVDDPSIYAVRCKE